MVEETLFKKITKINNETPFFRLFFLKNDKEKSVEIAEVEEPDFVDILRRLERGESIFISPKRTSQTNQNLIKKKDHSPWYFTHI